ncbi:MAG TPA: low molecular weight protein-tyrosine-phosphatase [Polyangiaceae bacterium]|nr:low molecular weight protein-tyrosine-phosphatase [Polyangiaceae bacterium]
MVRICFVCMGNICRSPTAEAVMRRLVEERGWTERFDIESAGTGDWHVGESADTRSRAAGLERGYRLDRRARHFTASGFAQFDYVIAADRDNFRHLMRIAPDDTAKSKIHLLRDFDPASPKGSDVPDPYYGGAEGFEHVLDVCEAACRALLAHLAAAWEKK